MNNPLLKLNINFDELSLISQLPFPYVDVVLEEYFSLDKATSESLLADNTANLAILSQKTGINKKELIAEIKKLAQLSQNIVVNHEFILKSIEQNYWNKESLIFFHLEKNAPLKETLPFEHLSIEFFSFARGQWLKSLEQYRAIFFYSTSPRRSYSAAMSLRKNEIADCYSLV